MVAVVVAGTLLTGAAGSAVTRSPSEDPASPRPTTFDPGSIRVRGWWHRPFLAVGSAYTMAIDGSDVRSLAPADEIVGEVVPGVWLERLSPPDCDGIALIRPGVGRTATWCGISSSPLIADGAVYAARGSGSATEGEGIWRYPADGRPPRRVWNLRDPELYDEIVVSADGRWIAAGPYLGQFRTTEPPGARVRHPDGRVTVLPTWLDPVGWDSTGRLILRGTDVVAWDPGTGRIVRLGRRTDDRWAYVVPGGRHVVVYGRAKRDRSAFGIIDVQTGRRRDISLSGDWDWEPELSTADLLVLGRWDWVGDDLRVDRVAIVSLAERWIGFVPYPPDPRRPPPGTDASNMPVPPPWFDPRAIPVLGSATGDPSDLGDGLWRSAVDGSGATRVAASAGAAATIRRGGTTWTQADGSGRWALWMRPNDGPARQVTAIAGPELLVSTGPAIAWVWRSDEGGTQRLWRIDLRTGSRRATPVPIGARDLRVSPDGREVSWTAVEDRVRVAMAWTARSGSRVVPWTVVGHIRGHRRLVLDGRRVITEPDDEWSVIAPERTTVKGIDDPGRVVAGPLSTGWAGLQRLVVTSPSSGVEIAYDVVLPRGSWQATGFGDRRYVVLRDGITGRYGVYDAREDWFGVLPTWSVPDIGGDGERSRARMGAEERHRFGRAQAGGA